MFVLSSGPAGVPTSGPNTEKKKCKGKKTICLTGRKPLDLIVSETITGSPANEIGQWNGGYGGCDTRLRHEFTMRQRK